MKFSLAIGNPPYQEIRTGGGSTTTQALPLYNKFSPNSLSCVFEIERINMQI